MPVTDFDAIIDDYFLNGAARFIARKYEGRTNDRAVKIIDEINKKGDTEIKAA
ncbi:hypothetical protein [Prochlorococcus marinus]|uniref:hypothetical protein n=1 Tax=Prochlorococcus marinus TaxID=1219 RepID=UPI0022B4B981|nr:hypothetical protein [Prochlorococcus marinus]